MNINRRTIGGLSGALVVIAGVVLGSTVVGGRGVSAPHGNRHGGHATPQAPSAAEMAEATRNQPALTVRAIDNTFLPAVITVTVGQEVVWENRGRTEHNVVPSDDAQVGKWGVTEPTQFEPKMDYRHTFTEPGEYDYYCSLHGTKTVGMIGKVIVVAAPTDTAATNVTPAPGSTLATTLGQASTPATGTLDPATTLTVPGEYPTIQGAVDAAKAGDLVLVSPGTYHEAVNVTTDGITIRGLDRNKVVLDGELKLDNGIRVLKAKGVAVENMTAKNYTVNGFFWTGVDGYRGSYLTAYRTGDYGVYAFDSVNGQLDHIYAAGSPDAGVYIGECYPCNAVVDRVVSEHNGLGYSGTNSGGNLLIVNSVFRNNRAGVVPNSGSYELCYPGRETTIVGNLVYSNNQGDTPAIDVALLAMGNGILVAGGVRNDIQRNRVWDHDKSGIGLVPFLEEDPNDTIPAEGEWKTPCADSKQRPVTQPEGAILWEAQQNRVIGNVLEGNRHADLIVASLGDVAKLGNCASGNTLTKTAPEQFEQLAPCDGKGSGDFTKGAYNIATWLNDKPPASADWKTAKLPELTEQPSMPDAATARARPATGPDPIDLASIKVPDKPAA